MASRHLNTRAYQSRATTDRTNGTLCSKPALENIGGEVPQPSAVKKIEKKVEANHNEESLPTKKIKE